jgi:hypothetical protein
MCHFFANPLSILLAITSIDPETLGRYLTRTHLDAIRSLPSMRNYVEEKLAEKDISEVRSLLEDDGYFLSLLPQFVDLLQSKAAELRDVVIVLSKLCERDIKARHGLADLYVDVLVGRITSETPFVRELVLLQRYLPCKKLI